MPQISQLAATYASQIFWLLVFFGVVFFVVGRGMLPRVQRTIDGRDQRISADLAAAKSARDEADRVEEAWRQREQANRERAQAIVADARARAARASEATLAQAGEEQAARVAAGEADIRTASQRAQGEIEQVAADAAQAIVERVAGLSVAPEEARGAVRAAMAHG